MEANNQSRFRQALKWIGVLPGAVGCAALAQFPIHWVVMLIRYSGTEVDANGTITYDNPLAAMPEEVLEYFLNAFFTPFIIISVGAQIAPKFKFFTGIALAIALAAGYAALTTFIAHDISSGLYTPGRWLRLAVTVMLALLGFSVGLLRAYGLDQRRHSE